MEEHGPLRTIALAALAASVIGCSGAPVGDEVGGWVGTVTEEDGVNTVRTLSGSAWKGSAELVEELVIGDGSRGEEDLFGDIGGIAAIGDSLLVMDRQWCAIRVLDADGHLLGLIGREGSGPGEFRSPQTLAVDPVSGHILVRESSSGRTHVLSPGGEYIRTLNPGLQGGWSGRILMMRVTVDGTLFLVNFAYRRGQRDDGPYVATEQLFRIDEDGSVAETIDLPVYEHPDYELRAYVRGGEAIHPEPVPFGPQEIWTLSHSGALISGYAGSYRLEVRRPDGTMMVIERAVDPVPVLAPERAWHERRVEVVQRRYDPTWRWIGPPTPETKPWFQALFPDRSGRLWLLRSGPGYVTEDLDEEQVDGLKEAGLYPPWTEDLFFDVFEEESGRFLGSVPCPEGLQSHPEPWVEEDVFVAAAMGPLGEPLLKRYRLVIGGPDGAQRR